MTYIGQSQQWALFKHGDTRHCILVFVISSECIWPMLGYPDLTCYQQTNDIHVGAYMPLVTDVFSYRKTRTSITWKSLASFWFIM